MKFFKQDVWGRPVFWQAMIAAVAIVLTAQTASAQAAQSSQSAKQIELKNEQILQQHYAAAQKYQAANRLDAAAQQYRIFLADALGELAIAEAHGNEYEKSSGHFGDALSLAPHSPALLVEYAELALRTGRVQQAETLAGKIIHDFPKDANAQARAWSLLGRAQLKQGKSADARKTLEKAVALNPDFLNGYELAVACLNVEDQKCAEKIFGEMESGYGNKAILHMYFGQAYMDSDFQGKAVGEFKEAVALDNKLPGAHYSLAAAYLVTGNHLAEAEEQLRQEIALYPKEAMARAALGHLEAGQSKYTEAEKELQTAAALAPGDPDTFLYLGQMYAALHENAKAEAALQKSIALTTDITRNQNQVQKAHYLLGRLLLQDGKRAEAQKQLQISQSMMNKNLSRAREQLANYYDQGSGSASNANAPVVKTAVMETKASEQSAEAAAGFAQRVGPSIANSYNSLGAIAGAQGNEEQAYEDFKHAYEWNPYMPGLDENLGRAAYSSYHFADAIAPLTSYLSLHPSDVTMQAALGVSFYMTNDCAKALSALQPVVQSGKVTDEVSYIHAECLVKTGKIREGIAGLKALVAKLPQEANVRRSLGEAYATNGDSSQAIEELQAAVKLNGKDAETHLDLAKVYEKLGRQQDAAREMQQYKSLTKESSGGK